MPSKSLIQFSVDGWGCVPSLFFDLRPNYGGDNEDNGDLLQNVLYSVPLTLQQDCLSMPLLESPGHSQASLGQSPVGSLLLSPGFWWVQGFACAPQESLSPVLCKFCSQIPLSSKVKFPGGSQSLCQIPRLGNLLWIYVIKHLSKPTECTTPRLNPNINCGHWMIMMCQGRLTSYNSVPSWWGMLMMKEATHIIRAMGIWEISVPSS